jgi:hypothetical protein
MKSVKNFVFAVLLLSVLSLNTVAGDIQTPGVAAPQPSPSPTNVMTATSESDSTWLSDPYSEQSGYLLYVTIEALLSVY